ncbi:type II secretion system F family protein [Rhizobium sp. FKL33]|jgi:tight adherence protein C|uniref:type II secretion system F family protein n=1 Tax=Rhizobium sp. FKL33 TaxID=2562307 RepID=UPI0010C153ED|nr:type II secretion system F family protein [Rhizobium sp. FKL33]
MELAQTLTNPQVVFAVLVGIAVFATLYSLVLPYFDNGGLQKRMKAVTTERDQIRSRERARLNAEGAIQRSSLRHQNNTNIRQIVERLNLREALVDAGTVDKLKAAGYRSQNALNVFLFARFFLPFIFMMVAAFYVFFLGYLADQTFMVRLLTVLGIGYLGFYAPNIFISNKINKRQASIRKAWPDALDLMLICVESGVSIEAAIKRVSEEMTANSPELAEEMVLTNAELSFLQERRAAYENLAKRTQLDAVQAVTQALIQAERYGTPIAQALRVLAQESRDQRMNEAEKKAAALPPKLTVPMILFFLPVLIAVILGPAGIQVSDKF